MQLSCSIEFFFFFIGAGVRALQSHITGFSCRSFCEFSHVLRLELQELGITQQWEVMQKARNYHKVLVTNVSWRQDPCSDFKEISLFFFFSFFPFLLPFNMDEGEWSKAKRMPEVSTTKSSGLILFVPIFPHPMQQTPWVCCWEGGIEVSYCLWATSK